MLYCQATGFAVIAQGHARWRPMRCAVHEEYKGELEVQAASAEEKNIMRVSTVARRAICGQEKPTGRCAFCIRHGRQSLSVGHSTSPKYCAVQLLTKVFSVVKVGDFISSWAGTSMALPSSQQRTPESCFSSRPPAMKNGAGGDGRPYRGGAEGLSDGEGPRRLLLLPLHLQPTYSSITLLPL